MADYTSIDWQTITFSAGQTAFGTYDAQPSFVTQSNKVVKYVARSLGWPIMDIQITPTHVFTAFQSAAMKYTAIVNQVTISDNLLAAYGQARDQDLTKVGIYGNLQSVFQISSMYGQQSTLRQSLKNTIYTASIDIQIGRQQYDLSECIPQYTASNVQILQVYHYPSLYRTAMMDPMINPGFNISSVMNEFGGVYASNARLIIMPIFETLLKMQTLQLTDTIRRSNYGFEIRKNKIIFYPPPLRDVDISIDYMLKSDKYQSGKKRGDVVTNIANYPILSNLPYSDINTVGRNWIYRYALALVKQILGLIRGKYTSIPYTETQGSLDGQTLRNEAIQQQDKLVEELKSVLQQSTMHRMIEKKSNIADNLQIINAKVPLRIWIA